MFLTIGIGYVLLLIAGCAWQRKLLYFPTKLSPEAAEGIAAEAGLVPWLNPLGENMGWKLPANGEATGSVLIVHGNGGCALNRNYLARPLHAVGGLDVFILEYPGYGARAGSPSKRSWLDAGEVAFLALPQTRPIYVVSESLGTGVAAHLAKLHPEGIAGMTMMVPYDSLPALAQSRMPLLLPYLFLVDRFQPAEWLKNYRGPIKFVLAGRDEIIPPKFGQRLFDSYEGPKSIQVVAGASHNEVAEQSSEWWRETIRFWQTGNQLSHQAGAAQLPNHP